MATAKKVVKKAAAKPAAKPVAKKAAAKPAAKKTVEAKTGTALNPTAAWPFPTGGRP